MTPGDIVTRVLALLRGSMTGFRDLRGATGLLFVARTRVGRWVKVLLFGVGVVLPLGSLIWALLYWHGNRLRRADGRGAAPTVGPAQLADRPAAVSS